MLNINISMCKLYKDGVYIFPNLSRFFSSLDNVEYFFMIFLLKYIFAQVWKFLDNGVYSLTFPRPVAVGKASKKLLVDSLILMRKFKRLWG